MQLFGPTAKGTPKWWDIIVLPVLQDESDKNLQQILSVSRDITKQKLNELKERELLGRFQNLVLQAPVAICVLRGKDYVIETINEGMVEMWGKKAEDVIDKPAFEVLPELLEQGFKTLLDNVYHSGERFVTPELPINLNRHGKLENAYVKFVYEPLREADGSISGVMALAHEITEQVSLRKKIEVSDERFQAAVSALKGIVWTNNAKGEMEGEQIGWSSLTGQSYQEYQGYGWVNAIHPDDAQPTIEAWNEAVKDRKNFVFEHRVKLKNGNWGYFSVKAIPLLNADGLIWEWVGVHTDITEQYRAEEAVRESEERFRQMAELMPQKVWTADAEGNKNYFNKTLLDYAGKSFEELQGNGWQQIIHPDDWEKDKKQWEECTGTGKDYEAENRLLRKDGEYLWHLTRAVALKDEDGKIKMWLGSKTEIHDQKTKEQAKDEFISIASHEMKTPLTIAKAYLQLLEISLDKDNENANLYAKKASQSVARLNELITELLDVSKIQHGKLDYNISTFNFNELVDNTVADIQQTSPKHTIIKSGKILQQVTGDKDRLQQVIINLLSNAIKYSPDSLDVYINIAEKNSAVEVSVKDNGIGISRQHLEKIFDRYYRVEEHAIAFQGLGIGLFISYEIIQRHHGKFWVESEPGKGSTFYFSLPVSQT